MASAPAAARGPLALLLASALMQAGAVDLAKSLRSGNDSSPNASSWAEAVRDGVDGVEDFNGDGHADSDDVPEAACVELKESCGDFEAGGHYFVAGATYDKVHLLLVDVSNATCMACHTGSIRPSTVENCPPLETNFGTWGLLHLAIILMVEVSFLIVRYTGSAPKWTGAAAFWFNNFLVSIYAWMYVNTALNPGSEQTASGIAVRLALAQIPVNLLYGLPMRMATKYNSNSCFVVTAVILGSVWGYETVKMAYDPIKMAVHHFSLILILANFALGLVKEVIMNYFFSLEMVKELKKECLGWQTSNDEYVPLLYELTKMVPEE